MNHLSVDIETLGKNPGAVILSVGLVRFDPMEPSFRSLQLSSRDLLHVRIVVDDDHPGKVDLSTVRWWEKNQLGPDTRAREKLFPSFTLPPKAAYTHINSWLDLLTPHMVWAKSPDFDLVLLKASFKQFKVPWILGYEKYRCVRTLRCIAQAKGWTGVPSFSEHSAILDAYDQADDIISYWRFLQGETHG